MAAAPSPAPALPPSIHSSPRQQALSSKIPRRRPSSHLASTVGVGASPRAASSPATTGPTSPTKSVLVNSGGGGGGGGHAHKSSLTNRAHFSDLPPVVFSSSGSGSFGGELAGRFESSAEGAVEESSLGALQDRRRRASSSTETREVSSSSRRTPSLSIYIPSSASSPAHHHPQYHSSSSLRRPSHPSRPSPSSAHPSSASSPAALHPSFAPHSRRSSARTPRSCTHPHPHSHGHGLGGRPPMMERTWSNNTTTTYTSFDLQHPRTPKEEREEREAMDLRERRGWLRRLFSRGGGEGDEERDLHSGSGGERAPLLSASRRSAPDSEARGEQDWSSLRYETRGYWLSDTVVAGEEEQEGSGSGGGWRYVWGEVWCYAKHILPPLLVFVVLVLVIALLAYRQAIHRVVHPPEA